MTEPSRFAAGAVDLAAVKQRAEAKAAAAKNAGPRGAGLAPYLEISQQNLEAEVAIRSQQVPVVMLLGAPSLPESETMRSQLEQLASESNLAFIFGYLNAETQQQLAAAMAQAVGAQSVPLLIAWAAGQPVAVLPGVQPAEQISVWVGQVISQVGPQLQGLPEGTRMAAPGTQSAGDDAGMAGGAGGVGAGGVGGAGAGANQQFAVADEALANGDYDTAIAEYNAVLEQDPKNDGAKAMRLHAQILQRQAARPESADPLADAVAASEAAPGNLDAAIAAADELILIGQLPAAFDVVVRVMQHTSGKEKIAAKDALLAYFDGFDAAAPEIVAARQKMASALY
ncbi:tetratricopeptide repeat protein [Corynebacterium ulceribovis]|uniref:tetratricopeptide repeat protein n=1 Tax=Corynebacterium ulceribovis TaxID=487732 RepID=UPI00036107D2|nr:tetratricopeptide repeat protein [Corynebacterium ulceribovis]